MVKMAHTLLTMGQTLWQRWDAHYGYEHYGNDDTHTIVKIGR